MKAKNRVISLLVAVFMVFAMMPMIAQEAYAAEKQVNMCDNYVVMGKTITVDTSKFTTETPTEVYAYFAEDDTEDFTKISSTSYSWDVRYDLDQIGGQFRIYVKTASNTYYTGIITMLLDITGADYSESIPDLTYTGKGVTHKKFEIDLGPAYFDKNSYTLKYSNNVNVGKATVKLTGKKSSGLTGTATATFNVRPKGTTAKAPKKGKKSFTAKWARQKTKMKKSRITGYQVQYSPTSDFSSGVKNVYVKGYKKTSRKIKGLEKKKVYYVHVRTYMKVGGKYYYSTWSKTKSVKTK